jgi:hypothetical protein
MAVGSLSGKAGRCWLKKDEVEEVAGELERRGDSDYARARALRQAKCADDNPSVDYRAKVLANMSMRESDLQMSFL